MPSSSLIRQAAASSSVPIYRRFRPDRRESMRSTRRIFLQQSAGVALAAHAVAAGSAGSNPARAGGDLLSRMTWFNAPAAEHYSEGVLTVRSKGKTDFWRKTF